MIRDIILILVAMLSLDFIYLGLMKSYFAKQIMDVQKAPLVFNAAGAVPCYIALVLGLYYFVVRQKKPVLDAFFLGIVIYSVFETTNLALFKKWRPLTVLMDTAWGGVLFALTTWIVYKAQRVL